MQKSNVFIFLLIFTLAVFNISAADWSYDGLTGPDHWGEHYPDANGFQQSPIDINEDNVEEDDDIPSLHFNYSTNESLSVVNNGHTVVANVSGINTLTIGNKVYTLLQFHFHTPSEHLVDGSEYIMEMHLVHKDASGELAVIGVFINSGKIHNELEKIWANLPANKSDQISVSSFNLKKLLPSNLSSYRYNGSLTTPPCTEGVKWNVLLSSIKMSGSQILKFVNIFSGNHFPDGNRRPVQPLNGRTICTDED